MSKLIDVEISKNIHGGVSLLISNKTHGFRAAGSKVGGCATVEIFTLDADDLINKIKEYAYREGEK